jgi:hypothetical protein
MKRHPLHKTLTNQNTGSSLRIHGTLYVRSCSIVRLLLLLLLLWSHGLHDGLRHAARSVPVIILCLWWHSSVRTLLLLMWWWCTIIHWLRGGLSRRLLLLTAAAMASMAIASTGICARLLLLLWRPLLLLWREVAVTEVGTTRLVVNLVEDL